MTTTAELSRRVAEWLDSDDAWYPAATCPQGHSNHNPDTMAEIGELCVNCTMCVDFDDDQWNDPTWRPEWRIQRGDPKPYAESLDELVPVVEAWCKEHGWMWWVGSAPGGGNMAQMIPPRGGPIETENANGDEPAHALAEAFLAAVEREEAQG